MTWERFCVEYKPGEFGRDVKPSTIRRETHLLETILANALVTLDARVVTPRPSRDRRVEEISCGLCYGNAA